MFIILNKKVPPTLIKSRKTKAVSMKAASISNQSKIDRRRPFVASFADRRAKDHRRT